jgi:ubiquinone/menaquinone biosynthesis C-methylase UbiE
MNLKELQRHWDEFGKTDPLWAIVSRPETKNGKWNTHEFFQTGEEEIARVMKQVDALGLLRARRKALDFGCGVGRLTQALCGHFDQAVGVDIAPSMIKLAEQFNRYGERCQYYLNEADDLSLFEDSSFDFVYSVIVLQHMQPEYSKKYLQEFLRILAPGGMLVFQLPSQPVPVQRTAASEPLSGSAFKAYIAVQATSLKMGAGSRTVLPVKIKNISTTLWPALGAPNGQYQIRLGQCWLDDRGKPLSKDGGRADMPIDVKPLAEVYLPLEITAPAQPGHYTLELDLVQESVAWFKDKGSEPARVSVQVKGIPVVTARWQQLRRVGRKLLSLAKGASFVPQMEMNWIPKNQVVEWIEINGGKVVDIQDDKWPGPAWESFLYFVAK